jgi:hypothetical protein
MKLITLVVVFSAIFFGGCATAPSPVRANPKIGMTQNEVLSSSWGGPSKINRTTTANGVHEQWVYRLAGGFAMHYIYFKNGRVYSIQD